MPTAARLISALALAAVMLVAVLNAASGLPEGTRIGWMRELSLLAGLLGGWFIVGHRPPGRLGEAMAEGIKGALSAGAWLLVLAAGQQMIRRALMGMHDGVSDAVLDLFARMVDLGALVLAPGVIGILLVGGALVGLLARWTAQRWT